MAETVSTRGYTVQAQFDERLQQYKTWILWQLLSSWD